MRFYDYEKNNLVFIENKANPKFWDRLWQDQLSKTSIIKKDLIIAPTTKMYLKKGSRILEGGCGHGSYVDILNKQGYECIGIDYAKETIKLVKKRHPDLPIYYGNLTKLKFGKNSFDAYWSIGVIEHFFYGYDKILQEMHRVLKKDGLAFVSFPYMSPLRMLKASLGSYERLTFKKEPRNFYQFALDHKKVIDNFEKKGFKLIKQKPYDGFSGLIKETNYCSFILNPIARYSKKHLFVAGIRFMISKIVEKFSSHSVLLVFRKVK